MEGLMVTVLKSEQETLEARLPELVKDHEDQFVVVHGREIWNFFGSQDEAIRAGRKHFGPKEPFLVALVTRSPRTIEISSFLLGHRGTDADRP